MENTNPIPRESKLPKPVCGLEHMFKEFILKKVYQRCCDGRDCQYKKYMGDNMYCGYPNGDIRYRGKTE